MARNRSPVRSIAKIARNCRDDGGTQLARFNARPRVRADRHSQRITRSTGGEMAKANRKNSSRNGRAQNQRGRGKRGSVESSNGRMDRISAGAAQLTRSANATGRRLGRSVTTAVEDNPLVVGAALFISGAAVGYALRGVLRDNEWLEEQRDAVVDKAREIARTASDKVNSLRQNRSSDPTEAH
jgi:hypothetical protein